MMKGCSLILLINFLLLILMVWVAIEIITHMGWAIFLLCVMIFIALLWH